MIFLRPIALLLLLVPVVLYFVLRRKEGVSNPWHKYVNPVFMKYLTVTPNQTGSARRGKFGWVLVWILFSLAIAGPAFEKLPASGLEEAPPTVLVVDLNTLNTEKQSILHLKLREILEQLKASAVGLVLYDTKGYIASPLTQDTELIESLVPSLKTRVMPDWGNKLNKGIEKAVELLSNTHYKRGRILVLTGGTPDLTGVKEALQLKAFSVGVLGIGADLGKTPILTRDGAFLRDYQGNLVLSEPQENVLKTIGVYQKTTAGMEDVQALLKQTELSFNVLDSGGESDFLKPDVWQDAGVYVALAALASAVFLFQRGLFFIFAVVMLSCPASASLWQRKDQEDYHTLMSGNQLYQSQNYEEALAKFEGVSTITALYNKANTLAHLKKYNEAIEMYEKVLQQDPNHQNAKFNKEYLEEQLKQKQEENSSQNESQNEQKNQDQTESQNQESSAQDNNEEDSSSDTDDSQKNQLDSSDESEQENPAKEQNADQNQEQNESQSEQENQDKTESRQDGSNSNQDNESSEEKNKNELKNQSSAQEDEQTADSEQQQSSKEEVDNQNSDDGDYEQSSANPSDGSPTQESDLKDDYSTAFEEDFTDSADQFDQETQQILNRLKKDESRVLRYRLYRQYMNQ